MISQCAPGTWTQACPSGWHTHRLAVGSVGAVQDDIGTQAFSGSADFTIHAYDLLTGEVQWKHTLPHAVRFVKVAGQYVISITEQTQVRPVAVLGESLGLSHCLSARLDVCCFVFPVV
jgi:hypothetical protein